MKTLLLLLLVACDDRRVTVTMPDGKSVVNVTTDNREMGPGGCRGVSVMINSPVHPLIVVPAPFAYERKPVLAEQP